MIFFTNIWKKNFIIWPRLDLTFHTLSTLLVGTCRHLKLSIVMLFDNFFATSKNTHHLASSLERGRIPNFEDFLMQITHQFKWPNLHNNLHFPPWLYTHLMVLLKEKFNFMVIMWIWISIISKLLLWSRMVLPTIAWMLPQQSCVTIKAPLNSLKTRFFMIKQSTFK
jgi:hypothetical protein